LNPIAVRAHNPGPLTGEGNTTWLITGRVPVLIDAGTGDPRHLDDLTAALRGSRLASVLVTHAHSDHASGARPLAARMPQVRFAKMPWPERDVQYPVAWERIGGGDVIQAGDEELMAVHTPGHAPDHLCFWHRVSGTLFSGDLVVEGSTVVIPASGGGDLASYIASLERVLSLEPSRLVPAHGPIVTRPAQLLRGYLAHRREREGQILDALRSGDATLDAIVARVYTGLASELQGMAGESVLAHLRKLQQDGRVRCSAHGWHII
jgi:glyoxylase-like metal-dependent hydrolase (beta-lactamase superfamily II)